VVFGDRHELELKGKLGHVAAFETRSLREDADVDN
jgi:hypothetical protein